MAWVSMLWLPNMPMGPQTRVDYCPLFIERESPTDLFLNSMIEDLLGHSWKVSGPMFERESVLGRWERALSSRNPQREDEDPRLLWKLEGSANILSGPIVLTLWNTHVFWGTEAWFQAIRVFFLFFNWFLLSSTFFFASLSASPLPFNSLPMSPWSQFHQEIHMGSRVFLLQIGCQLLALCPPQAFHQ